MIFIKVNLAIMKSISFFLFHTAKGGFFSESAMCFSNLQKTIFQKTILNLKFKFPANNSKVLLARNLNFKLRIVFSNVFFLEIWRFKKHIALSEKKSPLERQASAS